MIRRIIEMQISELFCVLVIFFRISEANEKHPEGKRDASSKFANLLNDIVSVNERRVEVMKELARLQDYSIGKYNLRTGKQGFDERDGGRPQVLFLIGGRNRLRTLADKKEQNWKNKNIEPYRSKQSDSSEDDDEDEEESLESVEIARKNWKRSCGKSMGKVCKKACENAYKNVCMSYSCKRKMKKRFKKECKRSCNSKFNKGKYSDSEE